MSKIGAKRRGRQYQYRFIFRNVKFVLPCFVIPEISHSAKRGEIVRDP